MRWMLAITTLALFSSPALAQQGRIQDEEALERKIERRERDLDYIDQQIQRALDHGNNREAERLNREYRKAQDEIDRLRDQLDDLKSRDDRRDRDRDRDRDRAPRRDMKEMIISFEIDMMAIQHGLGIGNTDGEPGDGAGGVAGGLGVQVRWPGVFLEYRNLETEMNETGLGVTIQEYIVGITSERTKLENFSLALGVGVININSDLGGPETDSGMMVAFEPSFRSWIGESIAFKIGVSLDWIWTDFNDKTTKRYSTGTFTIGFEAKF